MAGGVVLVDTTILIDFFRKTDKANSALVRLVESGYAYQISAVTEFEIYTGASLGQFDFWNAFLHRTEVLSFDKVVAHSAAAINRDLKQQRKQIAAPDLFIAATAITHQLPLATLNRKHFERVSELTLIDV
jgi:tRNA(fMet)-specific endonuclease VapC